MNVIKSNLENRFFLEILIKLGENTRTMTITNSVSDQNYSWATLLLRLVAGGFMLTHGIPKLQMLLEGDAVNFADPIGLGPTFSLILTVFAEFLCALCILFGFKTKLATIPLIITMLVASFVVHLNDPFGKKEFALLYLAMYAALFLLGSGKYSVDAFLQNRKQA